MPVNPASTSQANEAIMPIRRMRLSELLSRLARRGKGTMGTAGPQASPFTDLGTQWETVPSVESTLVTGAVTWPLCPPHCVSRAALDTQPDYAFSQCLGENKPGRES